MYNTSTGSIKSIQLFPGSNDLNLFFSVNFNKDGIMFSVNTYQYSKLTGPTLSVYNSGILAANGSFNDAKFDGEWKFYFWGNGRHSKIANYDNGALNEPTYILNARGVCTDTFIIRKMQEYRNKCS